MMKKKFNKTLILLWLIIPSFLYPAFEDTPSGARTLGMGEAFAAVEHDGEGVLINPAALSENYRTTITAMYSPLYLGLDDGSFNNGYINCVYHWQKIGFFSFNWSFFNCSSESVKDLYNEDQLVLTYKKSIGKDIYSGLRINYYKWSSAVQKDYFGNTESFASSALSLGIGFYYRKSKDLNIGLALNNVNMPRVDDESKGEGDIERLPFEVRPGISYSIKDILLAMDARFIGEDIDVHLGSEYWFLDKQKDRFFGVRLGVALPNLANGVNATAGLSLFAMKNLSLDYGFLIPITTVSSIWGKHKISLTYRFSTSTSRANVPSGLKYSITEDEKEDE